MSSSPIETERKYLIRYPDTAALSAMEGVRIWHIVQTYLLAPENLALRVRRIEEDGTVRYIRTEKRRISDLSAYEDERELTEAEYNQALLMADPASHPIEKTRYVVPHGDVCCEIDVYPFWTDRAVLEIELPDERTEVPCPAYLEILCEVSGDRRYSNHALSREIPMDSIR